MIEDAELLRRYAGNRSEAAFAELVRRRLDFVYGVALRQLGGDEHLAKDVTQRVFADLARKAAPLSRRPVLAGWLYRATQFAATDLVRSERRRRAREQEAQAMQDSSAPPGATVDWDKFRPMLEQVIGELGERDRDAVLLRFFETRSFADIGAALRLTEEAARKRVDRALDRLRTRLMKRGMTSTTAALAVALGQQSAVSAPVGFAATVTGAALSGTIGGGAVATTIFMTMSKLQVAVVSTLVLVGGSGFVLQERASNEMKREIALRSEGARDVGKLQEENQRLEQTAAEAQGYREDAVAVARLHDEAGALAERLQAAAKSKARAATAAASGNGNGDALTIYPLAQLDQAPAVTLTAKPIYPFEMRQAGISGQVTVTVKIDQNGEVSDAFASKSTRPEFEAAAVAAVKKWKFQAAQKGGLPVNSKLEVPIVFSLNNEN